MKKIMPTESIKNVKKLKNGMRVHLVPIKGTQAATVLVLTKVGSRYEPDSVWGGSHFIEHLMFKGTEKHPNTVDIARTLDRYGAEYNAYTGKEYTGYYVKINGDKMPVAVDLLYDMLFHSLFDPEEMDRERKVIAEEIKMYEENPIMHLEDLLEQAMFDGNPLGRNIAGTRESVADIKRDDLLEYRDAYYAPSQMVIAVSGNIPGDIVKQLEATFGGVKERKEPKSHLPFGDMPERDTPRVGRQFKDVEQIQVGLGFPTPGKAHKDIPAIKILTKIMGGAMSSRLFTEVRERRGLCYAIRASSDTYQDVGTFTIRAGLDAGRLELALKTIFDEIKKVKTEGVSEKELKYAQDNIEGEQNLSLEDSRKRAEFYAQQELFTGKAETLEERMKKYKQVKRTDVKRLANEVLNNRKLSVAAIGPYKTERALLEFVPVLM